MTDLTEITKAIGRHRRAMPRNEDALLICRELELRLQAPGVLKAATPKKEEATAKFDKTAYQRELMRKRRAAAREARR